MINVKIIDLEPEYIVEKINNPINIRTKYKYTLGKFLPLKNKTKNKLSKAIYELKIDLAICKIAG